MFGSTHSNVNSYKYEKPFFPEDEETQAILCEDIDSQIKADNKIVLLPRQINHPCIQYLNKALSALNSNSINHLKLYDPAYIGEDPQYNQIKKSDYLPDLVSLLDSHKNIIVLEFEKPMLSLFEWNTFKGNASLLKVIVTFGFLQNKGMGEEHSPVPHIDTIKKVFKLYTSVLYFDFIIEKIEDDKAQPIKIRSKFNESNENINNLLSKIKEDKDILLQEVNEDYNRLKNIIRIPGVSAKALAEYNQSLKTINKYYHRNFWQFEAICKNNKRDGSNALLMLSNEILLKVLNNVKPGDVIHSVKQLEK